MYHARADLHCPMSNARLFQPDDPCSACLTTFLCDCCATIQEKNQMNSNPGAGMQVMLSARLTSSCFFSTSLLAAPNTLFFRQRFGLIQFCCSLDRTPADIPSSCDSIMSFASFVLRCSRHKITRMHLCSASGDDLCIYIYRYVYNKGGSNTRQQPPKAGNHTRRHQPFSLQ